jgi:hypothetical protein
MDIFRSFLRQIFDWETFRLCEIRLYIEFLFSDFSVVDLSTTSQMSKFSGELIIKPINPNIKIFFPGLDSAYDDVEFATDRLNSLKSPSAALLPSFVGNL